jgi:ABC-type transporter Mla subunit MlaD
MLRSIGRDRAVPMIVAAICIVALATVGLRYWLLRADRRSTEHTVQTLSRTTTEAVALLRSVTAKRTTVDDDNTETRTERDRVRAVAVLLHAELDQARANTTASAIGAFVSGTQANDLGECLTGVSQALNQLSVGDGRSIQSLQKVDGPCRRAGIG